MNLNSTDLGALLKITRQKSGLSVERMSELCGVHRNTICNWERDAKSMPYLAVSNYCHVLRRNSKRDNIELHLQKLVEQVCLSTIMKGQSSLSE